MRSSRTKLGFLLGALILAGAVFADEVIVSVMQYADCGGELLPLQDEEEYVSTGDAYDSLVAPTMLGYIFTHWSLSTDDQLDMRDAFGRAYDKVSFIPYQDTDLIAHYVPESQDSDDDGVADGDELYWYGDLDETTASDSDGDGIGFADELANCTNPHFANRHVHGKVKKAVGVLVLINPNSLAGYVIRSSDDILLGCTTNYIVQGELVSTPLLSPTNSAFAYWTINGEPVRDAFGRAADVAQVEMPEEMVVFEAVAVTDAAERLNLYWYGTNVVDLASDTDGDGFTYAEELTNGTNPHFPDSRLCGRIRKTVSDSVQFNPFGFSGCIIRAEDGILLVASTNLVVTGERVTTPTLSPTNSPFAYWMVNGVIARDGFGRALDRVSMFKADGVLELSAVSVTNEVERQKLYWYGTTDITLDSDTDGDGYTFAEELANGTNPHFPNMHRHGRVRKANTTTTEVNGQGYEKVPGVVVDGEYCRLFDAPNAQVVGESVTFANGAAIWPVVADVNGDGLWDLIVFSDSATNVFVNVGSLGNPQFDERTDLAEAARPWCDMNSTAKLAALSLDIAPAAALSATTNGNTLLASDAEGRIWYYTSQTSQTPQTSQTFSLQHKVWGGSYAGFANGLRLAAVDWDDDGDLDCLCGTAEGKLMLLRDPKVGRPTNLKADAGADNVLLSWDPNAQSRVRGYKVYRAVGASSDYGVRGAPALPTYRDERLSAGEYSYKVSALSRFYTAGNSTPTVTESVSTEPVTATVGGPVIAIGDPVKMPDGTVQIVVSINNSMNYQAAGTSIAVPYNAANLAYQKTLPSGISEKLVYKTTAADGVATIAITTGEVAPGSGTFFTLVFHGLSDGVLMGDLDGDGDVDEDDLRILIRASSLSGRKYTDYQLKAGDFNHNGKLDKGDVQSLRELLKNLGTMAGK